MTFKERLYKIKPCVSLDMAALNNDRINNAIQCVLEYKTDEMVNEMSPKRPVLVDLEVTLQCCIGDLPWPHLI